MLLTFLYHRIGKDKYSNSIEMIESNLSYLAKKYKIVVPGDKLSVFKINICLTFDDAYFDFYHYIFPILKKLISLAIFSIFKAAAGVSIITPTCMFLSNAIP